MGNSSLLLLLLMIMMTLGTKGLASLPNNNTTNDFVGDADGGFSSLDGMLQWAIGHSDPAKLKQSANQLSTDELDKRRFELKQVLEQLKMPSDAELMRIAIQDLNNSSLPLQDRVRALHELLILVEPIDNANDLHKLGGLDVIIQELNHSDGEIRKLAAWILGEASQNNFVVQNQVLELGALSKLMKMLRSDNEEEANKGLYAVSALVRNNMKGQQMLYAEDGGLVIEDILGNPKADIRLVKKAVILVCDLAESQLERLDKDAELFFRSQILLKSVIDLTASSDTDLQEKALMAIKNVMQPETSKGNNVVLKHLCGLELDLSLERMRQMLIERLKTTEQEYLKDYIMNLENLRSQVQLMFRSKLHHCHHHLDATSSSSS